jgi:hypothetical protein
MALDMADRTMWVPRAMAVKRPASQHARKIQVAYIPRIMLLPNRHN